MQGTVNQTGKVVFSVRRSPKSPPKTLTQILYAGLPIGAIPAEVKAWRWRNISHFYKGFWRLALAKLTTRITGIPIAYGMLRLVKILPNGQQLDYGVASLQKVTTAFVNFVADAMLNATTVGTFDFHGFGTGTTAENNADTDIETEFTTEYASDNVRPTGTPSNPSANVYQSVGTFAPNSGGTLAVTEHGLLSSATVGAGTLLDRSVFSAVNVVSSSDTLEATYQLTLTAEA